MSDYITEDNLLQILKWLPAKSLLRFRSVCKGWKQLIDSPSFILDHLGGQKPRCILSHGETQFLVLDSRSLPSFDTVSGPIDVNYQQSFDIVGTLHGIVCLGNDEGVFSLWNPSIRKFLCLPRAEFMQFDLLGFNINEMGRFIGFWLDPLTKDFKLIFFKLYSYPNDSIHGTLFSSSQQYWRVLDLFPLEEGRNCHQLQENPPVVNNETGYWKADCEDGGNDSVNVIVLSFDFVQERFDIIEAPYVQDNDYFQTVVSNWRGSLSLVYVDSADQRCSIFLRQDGLWINMFAFNLPCYINCLLCVLGDTEERIRILATKGPLGRVKELVLCDTKTGCDTLMSQLQQDSEELYLAYDFVESLLFP